MLSFFSAIAVAFAPPSILSRSRVQQSRVSAISCTVLNSEAAIKIFEPKTAVLQDPSEDTVYAIASSESGYSTMGSAGITVQKGTSGTLHYEITMYGVSSSKINENDHKFASALSEEDMEKYSRLKQDYHGGLNIPCLSWLGINLGANVDKDDMDSARSKHKNYNELAHDAHAILTSHQDTKITIKGSLRATGISMIPTTVTAFVKVAQVKFSDGNTMKVVSNDPSNVVAADSSGRPVPTDNQKLNIIPAKSAALLTAEDLSLPLP